ncbi:MAG: response regulator transcription factor [Bacteroidetes bacterium]|nr:response regulator transcription factor [Bacteroidota bacterium]
MSAKIRVVLADDHLLVMEGFRDLLSKAPNIEIVGEAADGEQAVFLSINRKPDILLMDINMPVLDGINATERITKSNKAIKIVMLSMHHEERYIIMADQAGAAGYLLKNIDKEELLHAIEMIQAGNKYYSKAIPEELVQRVLTKKYQVEGNQKADLTSREIEILKEIAKGLTNKEIGDKLFISDRTVNAHRTNIMAKLQAKNAVELVVKAMEMKII